MKEIKHVPGMCETCPRRALAQILVALGRGDEADEVLESGCSAWWNVPEEDPKTGQTRWMGVCGMAYLPTLLRNHGADVERVSTQLATVGVEVQRAADDVQQAAQAVTEFTGRLEEARRELDAAKRARRLTEAHPGLLPAGGDSSDATES